MVLAGPVEKAWGKWATVWSVPIRQMLSGLLLTIVEVGHCPRVKHMGRTKVLLTFPSLSHMSWHSCVCPEWEPSDSFKGASGPEEACSQTALMLWNRG